MKKTILMSLLLALVSCATKKTIIGKNEVVKRGRLSISTPFLKSKSKLFAGEFSLRNLNKKSIIIYLADIECKWGNQRGVVKNDRPFNIGEKVININSMGMKVAKFRCTVQSEGSGEMQLIVKRIYDNPNHDGKSVGKLLTKNIVWRYTLK